MASEFRLRVTLETALVVAAVAASAAWLAGSTAAVGVLAAGALTVGNFWWLSRAVSTAADLPSGRFQIGSWVVASGARLAVLFVAFAALCAGGYAHPVALVVGLSVLPCVLIARGLHVARETT